MNDLVFNLFGWIKEDWYSNRLRFIIEVMAWAGSITCSVIMMMTVPNPPFLLLYPMFISQCVAFAWSAWNRQSFGMLANYLLLVTIDSIALIRML